MVLRHQLKVLRRPIDWPELNDDDRSLLGAIAAALPRRLRHGWIVAPETLLRWHRRRIARHWTNPSVVDPAPVRSAVTWTEFLHSQAARAPNTETLHDLRRPPPWRSADRSRSALTARNRRSSIITLARDYLAGTTCWVIPA